MTVFEVDKSASEKSVPDVRLVNMLNVHVSVGQEGTYLFFSTYTMDLTSAGGIEGIEINNAVRRVVSFMVEGIGETKRDVCQSMYRFRC